MAQIITLTGGGPADGEERRFAGVLPKSVEYRGPTIDEKNEAGDTVVARVTKVYIYVPMTGRIGKYAYTGVERLEREEVT